MKNDGILTRQQWAEQARDKNAMTFETPLRKIVRTEVVVKDVNPDTGMHDIGFVISTASIDREGDIIVPDGWDLENYKQNPVVLWAHDYHTPPIGKAIDVSVKDGVLVATDRFTPEDINPFGAMIYRMVKGGFLKATSVGFKPVEWTYNEDHRGYDFARSELLEHSVVPVPANPEALVMASAAGIDMRPMREWVSKILDRDQSVQQFALVPRGVAEEAWKHLSSVGASVQMPSVTSGYLYLLNDTTAKSDCVNITTTDHTGTTEWGPIGTWPVYETWKTWSCAYDDEQERKEKAMEELLKQILEAINGLRTDMTKLSDQMLTTAAKGQEDEPDDDSSPSDDELRSMIRGVVGEVLTAKTGRLPD